MSIAIVGVYPVGLIMKVIAPLLEYAQQNQ